MTPYSWALIRMRLAPETHSVDSTADSQNSIPGTGRPNLVMELPKISSKGLERVGRTLKLAGVLLGVGLLFSNLEFSDGAESASARPSPFSEKAEFQRYAEKLRESAIQSLEPSVRIPSTAYGSQSKPSGQPSPSSVRSPISSLIANAPFQSSSPYPAPGTVSQYSQSPYSLGSGRYPWKTKIVTTVFWVGESATVNNPVHNRSSSWDQNWKESFGGYDNPDPSKRKGFIPAAFVPKLNPFYCALPYNDVAKGGHKPEARSVIPWFRQTFVKDGQSVCRDRWIAIRNSSGRLCFAQWNDCGPYRTDHWEYVFGRARPIPNMNGGAGLDVSPAVRDYLKLNSIDVTDWKFVDFTEIPKGPWSDFGENNEFVMLSRRSRDRMATNPSGETDGPKVFAR